MADDTKKKRPAHEIILDELEQVYKILLAHRNEAMLDELEQVYRTLLAHPHPNEARLDEIKRTLLPHRNLPVEVGSAMNQFDLERIRLTRAQSMAIFQMPAVMLTTVLLGMIIPDKARAEVAARMEQLNWELLLAAPVMQAEVAGLLRELKSETLAPTTT